MWILFKIFGKEPEGNVSAARVTAEKVLFDWFLQLKERLEV